MQLRKSGNRLLVEYDNGNIDRYDIASTKAKELIALATKPEPRMAGNALESAADDIIGQLRDEASYEKSSNELEALQELVLNLKGRDSEVAARWDAALSQAGLDRSHLNNAVNINENDIQLIANINSRTPQAVQFNWADDTVSQPARGKYPASTNAVPVQTRLHSQFEVNPLTGQLDVVPVLDKASGTPLVTQFGRVGQSVSASDVEGMDSDEFLGKRIMQLAGAPVVRNNDSTVTAVDLVNSQSGEKVDVEMAKTRDLNSKGSLGFQVYTEMAPRSISGTRPMRGSQEQSRAIASEMARELRPMIAEKMRGGLSLSEALSSLERERKISNSDGSQAPYAGKLLKEEGNYVDKIVTPVVTPKDAALNLATERQDGQRGLVMPLEGALLSDVRAVQEKLRTSGPELLRNVELRPMPGNRGQFRPSAKLYVNEPLSSPAVQDLSKTTALVRQLFRKQ